MKSNDKHSDACGCRSQNQDNLLFLLKQARTGQSGNARIGVAVGTFTLIHAGTIHFLRQVRSECDVVLAAVLRKQASGDASNPAAQLLRFEERLQMLRGLEEVDEAGFLDSSDLLPEFPPLVSWHHSVEEDDVDADFLAALRQAGARVVAVGDTGNCTTRDILERMRRGTGG